MGNILVCDDERSICEMLDISLRKEGHKVETVTPTPETFKPYLSWRARKR